MLHPAGPCVPGKLAGARHSFGSRGGPSKRAGCRKGGSWWNGLRSTGGSHIGSTAKVVSKDVKRSSKANEVKFEEFGTIADYVFLIGSEKDLPLEVEA